MRAAVRRGLSPTYGFEPVILPVGRDGLARSGRARGGAAAPTLLVSIMAVNNEIGVVQDIRTLAAIARRAGALFHTDAPQAVGKIPLDVAAWGVDLLSLSGHKVYGPKGVGALYRTAAAARAPRPRCSRAAARSAACGRARCPTPLIVGLGEASRIAAAEMDAEAERIGGAGRAAARRAAARIPGIAAERLEHGAHSRQPEPDLPRRDRRSTLMERAPGPLRLHRFGLHLGRDRALPRADARSACLRTRRRATLRIGIGRFNSAADIDYAAAALCAAHAASPRRRPTPERKRLPACPR